ncbi:MAG: hypothetical protein CM1200mP41_22990 [Gammaproteobacteria bacterium]|nr:MAG: hypothetical protein CM1200mP41_22990 [Gammaproteobacteria bacterium]
MLQIVVFILFWGTSRSVAIHFTHDLMTVIKGVIFWGGGDRRCHFSCYALGCSAPCRSANVCVLLGGLLWGLDCFIVCSENERSAESVIRECLGVGAGVAGDMLVRDFKRARPRVYEPVAFVDDDDKNMVERYTDCEY